VNIIGPFVAAATVVLGAFVFWLGGAAILSLICTSINLPPMVAEPIAIFGPICAMLYASARW
jgi:hypothetical protein